MLTFSILFSNFFLLYLTKKIPIDAKYIPNSLNIISNLKYHMFKTATSLFLMGGYILICYTLIALIPKITILNWYLEFSSGCLQVLQQNIPLQLPILGSILSFGSFSIHLQTFSSLQTIKIRYTNYLMYRILQSLVTFLILLFIQFFF